MSRIEIFHHKKKSFKFKRKPHGYLPIVKITCTMAHKEVYPKFFSTKDFLLEHYTIKTGFIYFPNLQAMGLYVFTQPLCMSGI